MKFKIILYRSDILRTNALTSPVQSSHMQYC